MDTYEFFRFFSSPQCDQQTLKRMTTFFTLTLKCTQDSAGNSLTLKASYHTRKSLARICPNLPKMAIKSDSKYHKLVKMVLKSLNQPK